MSNNEAPLKAEKEVLRVALDKGAMAAYHSMIKELKRQNEFIKAPPSAFVSFLVSEFFKSHFQENIDLLVAQFFDSQSYYEAQLKAAKASSDFEETMGETLAFIKRVKAKASRKAVGSKKAKDDNAPAQNK